MEITKLHIVPRLAALVSNANPVVVRAECEVTFDDAVVVTAWVCENKKGLYVRLPDGFDPVDDKVRKSIENRILATWVINYCVDEYSGKNEAALFSAARTR